MVFQSMQKQSRYKREQGQKKTSGHDVNPSAMQKDLKSGETISIDGQECVKVDEWNAGDNIYVVGNSVEDSDFFYASVNGKDFFDYDHKPYRDEVEDDYIDLEAMRDIDRHEAEVYSRFEGGAEPGFYYAISLTSDASADSYYISVMDGSTGEEIQSYRDSHGDMPTFGTVDEAAEYCHKNGIDFENAAEVDQWHTIEIERAKAVPDGQIQKDSTDKPLTADDIQNLVLTNREYFAGSRTTVYDFECDIRGEHDTLQYTLEYHDDGEGFTIHTEKDDIWERMPEPELERLEGILSREAVYFKYHEKIAGAESLEALKELEYEIMEDESPYFSAVSERVWNDFTRKEEMLSGKTQETSGHDVQTNSAKNPLFIRFMNI